MLNIWFSFDEEKTFRVAETRGVARRSDGSSFDAMTALCLVQ